MKKYDRHKANENELEMMYEISNLETHIASLMDKLETMEQPRMCMFRHGCSKVYLEDFFIDDEYFQEALGNLCVMIKDRLNLNLEECERQICQYEKLLTHLEL